MLKNRVIPLAVTALLATGCATTRIDGLTARQKDLLTYGALTAADAALTYVAVREGGTEINLVHSIGGRDAATVALSVAVTGAVFGYLLDRWAGACGHDHRAWRSLNILRGVVDGWDLVQVAKLRKENE